MPTIVRNTITRARSSSLDATVSRSIIGIPRFFLLPFLLSLSPPPPPPLPPPSTCRYIAREVATLPLPTIDAILPPPPLKLECTSGEASCAGEWINRDSLTAANIV